MEFKLPDLPYSPDALAPNISAQTLEFHHGKHHAGYVKKLNAAVEGTPFEKKSLEEIVCEAREPAVFNNAAQCWNHAFYWNSMSPSNAQPEGELADLVKSSFGSVDKLKKAFLDEAAGHFGSGWAWLVLQPDGTLGVTSTHDAANPLTTDDIPLLTCDVWEHAYYLDYQNQRPKYLEQFWETVNWEFVAQNLAANAAPKSRRAAG